MLLADQETTAEQAVWRGLIFVERMCEDMFGNVPLAMTAAPAFPTSAVGVDPKKARE